MHCVLIVCLLLLFAVTHFFSVSKLTEQHAVFQKTINHEELFALPAPILKIVSLDYKGLVADVLFMKSIVYLGGFVSQKGAGKVEYKLTESQWHAFYTTLDISTDLDPYFVDPYYLANAFLTWDAGMVRETNALLDKGSKYRDWDWSLSFFAGFNYFFFLQENDRASEKLMEASRRNKNNLTLASLASKLAFKANKTETSILFLEEMIKKTDDGSQKKQFEMLVEAFKKILVLEKAVIGYRHKFKMAPKNINELVKNTFIAELPTDPYGGKYFIDAQGNVRTTSEDQLLPHVRKKQPVLFSPPFFMPYVQPF